MSSSPTRRILLGAIGTLALGVAPAARAQISQVLRAEFNSGGGVFDIYGDAIAVIGDVDGDGIQDLAIGAASSRTTSAAGAVWIAFMKVDGTVRKQLEIREGKNGFSGDLDLFDYFGTSVAGLGDLDGDGVPDVAVGARGDDESASFAGAIYVLFLNNDGTVKSDVRIPAPTLGVASLAFGLSLASLGDMDGDGSLELAVGTGQSVGKMPFVGSVYLLSLETDGTLQDFAVYTKGQGGAFSALNPVDSFGTSLVSLGDLTGDGTIELAVGAPGDDASSKLFNTGSVWMLSINPDKTLAGAFEIDANHPALGDVLTGCNSFGSSLACLGDIDGDGRIEIAAGAETSSASSISSSGIIFILSLSSDGDLLGFQELYKGALGWDDPPLQGDLIGQSVAAADLAGDGNIELFCGDLTGSQSLFGAVWALELCSGPVIDFDASTTSGDFPLTIAFTNLSTGTGSLDWAWDFGDGQTSTLSDPTHTYTAPGSYSVSLTATDDFDVCTLTESDLIVVTAAASLTVRNGSGTNPVVYASSELPTLGTTWNASVDAGPVGASGTVALFSYTAPLAGFPTALGELLVDPTSALQLTTATLILAGSADFPISIPNDLSLQGLANFTQALFLTPLTLTNALDLVIGT